MTSTVQRGLVNKFNRGVADESFFAREDVDRLASSAQLMDNFMPKRLGPMRYRPGSGYLQDVDTNARMIPFVSSLTDKYLCVWDDNGIRFLKDGAWVVTEGSPSIINGGPFSNLTGWTVADDPGCSTTAASTRLLQTGSGVGTARASTILTFTAFVTNYLRFRIYEGPVNIKIGGAAGEGRYFDDYLENGEHWIGVNTDNNTAPVLTVENDKLYETEISLITAIAGGTDVNIDPSWFNSYSTGIDTAKFKSYNWDQSADVLYMAVPQQRPLVITRWNEVSFGMNNFQNKFGPYDPINDTDITLDAVSKDGPSNIVASREGPFEFGVYPDGRLIRYAATGQQNSVLPATANDDATDPILVFGSGDARVFGVFIDHLTGGPYTEIVLEKSFDNVSWLPVKSYTSGADFNENYNDELGGSEIYYRLRVENIGTATAVDLTLSYAFGVIEGQWRGAFNTLGGFGTTVGGNWYVNSGSAEPTRDWYLGSWRWKESTQFGFPADIGTWPSAVAFFEGRLWWGGFNKFWGSESDFYESYDRNVEGDSASIERTIGFGPVEQIAWLAATDYLFAGIPTAELNIRSNNRAVTLTPSNTNVKLASSYGSAYIRPQVWDGNVVFSQRGRDKLLKMGFDGEKSVMEDLNLFTPDIFVDKIRRIEIARNPENRIYVLTDANEIWVALVEDIEDVLAWSRIKTRPGDVIQDICILPGDGEDEIYVVVTRGGQAMVEKFATFRESVGGNISKHFDAFTTYTSPGSTISISNLANGDEVGVWVDGAFDGLYTIATGQITGVTVGTDVVVGLQYTAQYRSNKLTDHSDTGTINTRKRPINTGLIMKNYHYVVGGLKYGPDFTDLDNMPLLEDGTTPLSGSYDYFPFEFSGVSETDPRICLEATQPMEIVALAYDMKDTESRTPRQRGG